MASSRRPTVLGPIPAPKTASAGENRAAAVEDDEESTTVDQGPPVAPQGKSKDRWEEKTHREGSGSSKKARKRSRGDSAAEEEDEVTVKADDNLVGPELGTGTIDELTVEDQTNPPPPLSIVPPLPAPKPQPAPRLTPIRPINTTAGRLIVTAGNDNGREFELTGKPLVVGRGIDCSVVLTDIAVSRKHLQIDFDGRYYTLRDLGSGNGTLINDRLEDGVCQLQHGDRLELGNTIIRFEHPASKTDQAVIGWGDQADVDEEARTLAGKGARKSPPLAAKISSPDLGVEGPPPEVLQGLMLPGSPPGAVVAADGPHAPLARERDVPGPPPDGSPPLPMPQQPTAPVGHPLAPGMSQTPLPQAAGHLLLSPDAYAEELHPQLLPTNRNRIIIGLILATLGVVLLAIIATIIRSTGSSTTAAAVPATDAGPAEHQALTEPRPEADNPAQAATDAATAVAEPSPPPNPPSIPAPSETLPVSTWGTNEILLASRDRTPHTRVDAPESPQQPAAAPPSRVEQPKPERKHPPARHKPTRKTKRTRSKPRRTATASSKKGSSSAARKKAEAFYQKKQFGSAAAALRAAADSASDDEASQLRALAKKYETVGASLTKARANKSSSPTTSMAAYRRALSLDKSVGNSTHATYIRLQLGAVAPLAAASYMAQKRYEAAKKAADAAVNYGAGANATVKRVRNALERKAGEFYQSAIKMKKKKPNSARKLLRRVIKMVPADSPWYAKAYKALNARNKSRDEDE